MFTAPYRDGALELDSNGIPFFIIFLKELSFCYFLILTAVLFVYPVGQLKLSAVQSTPLLFLSRLRCLLPLDLVMTVSSGLCSYGNMF